VVCKASLWSLGKFLWELNDFEGFYKMAALELKMVGTAATYAANL
jgi:hypothetical protein